MKMGLSLKGDKPAIIQTIFYPVRNISGLTGKNLRDMLKK